MIITRWQAPVLPTLDQATTFFRAEDLIPNKEVLPVGTDIKNIRLPFDEVRIVLQGELFFDIVGNQLILRPGDKIILPSNTKHSKKVMGNEDCISLVAIRPF